MNYRHLLIALTLTAVSLSTQAQEVLMKPQTLKSRALWASIADDPDSKNPISLGSYKDHNGKVLVSWRMLPQDNWDTAFDLYYRKVSSDKWVQLNKSWKGTKPITTTNYQIASKDFSTEDVEFRLTYTGSEETLATYTMKAAQLTGKLPYVTIPLRSTEDVADPSICVYTANDCSIGDLDGDGEMEIVVKRLQSRVDGDGNVTGIGEGASYSIKEVLWAVIWDAYKLDGTFLWRIKGGPGVILGNSSAFAIADFDGDGCAEMAIRTTEGTVFGDGQQIPDVDGDGKIDYRTWGNLGTTHEGYLDHYCSAGPEFLSIIDGKTGRELARENYINRETSESWGDDYWKRACSFRVAVGCFDGDLPSVVIGRGVYAHSVIEAWDYRNGQLTKRWRFDTNDGGTGRDGKKHSTYAGQGNHSLNVGDVDGDGFDEVMYGSMMVDHDGIGLWNSGLGHGDANHMGKFMPDREGMQVFHCLESGTTNVALHDAKTGEVIYKNVSSSASDCGRCLIDDIDPDNPGCEIWWAGSNAHTMDGKDLGYKPSSCNAGIWFDGGLSRQMLNENIISNDRAGGRTFTIYRYDMTFINSTKSNTSWYGDVFGDWREEFIVPDRTRLDHLKIFSTWYPSDYKFPWLMTDHTYYLCCLIQNIGYNQPNHIGEYFLGTGMDMTKVPVNTDTGIQNVNRVQPVQTGNSAIYDLNGRRVTKPGKGIYVVEGKKVVY